MKKQLNKFYRKYWVLKFIGFSTLIIVSVMIIQFLYRELLNDLLIEIVKDFSHSLFIFILGFIIFRNNFCNSSIYAWWLLVYYDVIFLANKYIYSFNTTAVLVAKSLLILGTVLVVFQLFKDKFKIIERT